MNVRQATADDLPALFEHNHRHFAESGTGDDVIFHPVTDYETFKKEEYVAKTLESLESAVSQPGWQRIWICETDGEIHASSLLRAGHMAPTNHRCQFAIGIEREWRGQGLGKRLSLLAISWAKQQRGMEWIDLWVFAHNAPAIALYERLGFEKIDVVRDQFRVMGKKIDDLHMTLNLRP